MATSAHATQLFAWFGPVSIHTMTTPTAATHALPVLSALPVIGRAFFAQPLVTYALYLIAPLLALTSFATEWRHADGA